MTSRSPKNPHRLLGVVLVALGACSPAKLDLFDSGATTGETATGADQSSGANATDPTTTTTAANDATGGGPVSCVRGRRVGVGHGRAQVAEVSGHGRK